MSMSCLLVAMLWFINFLQSFGLYDVFSVRSKKKEKKKFCNLLVCNVLSNESLESINCVRRNKN